MDVKKYKDSYKSEVTWKWYILIRKATKFSIIEEKAYGILFRNHPHHMIHPYIYIREAFGSSLPAIFLNCSVTIAM